MNEERSLSEVHSSVTLPEHRGLLERLVAFAGPAYLGAVGYMDPGNWATDIAAGSRYGYALVWVLVMSNAMAILLQSLSARLGLVSGRDLAQACRDRYPASVNVALWILCEVAIAACDLAEVIGSAIGLQLLFGIPLIYGVLITALDTFLILFLHQAGIRKMEAFILVLVATIAGCFLFEILVSRPDLPGIARGVLPSLRDSEALVFALGILGATVMPHNLYLHSSLVQSRRVEKTARGVHQSLKFNLIDSVVALNLALFINAAALISAGQSSTITGTLAGQIVMEAYVNIRLRPWLRRIVTRAVAIVPAVLTIVLFGDRATGELLVLSQVVLSLQLSFAVIPLIHMVSDRKLMGAFAIRPWVKLLAWTTAGIIVVLNAKLVIGEVGVWMGKEGTSGMLARYLAIPVIAAVGFLLLFVLLDPFFLGRRKRREPADVHKGPELEGVEPARPFGKVAAALAFADNQP